MAIIDTNVLIDILAEDPDWAEWSRTAVLRLAGDGRALITNGIVYSELCVGERDRSIIDGFLDRLDIDILPMSRDAFFMAGRAFATYRRHGGPRTSLLPDFIIGAHAADLGVPLLTRDTRRYRTYFPDLELIAP